MITALKQIYSSINDWSHITTHYESKLSHNIWQQWIMSLIMSNKRQRARRKQMWLHSGHFSLVPRQFDLQPIVAWRLLSSSEERKKWLYFIVFHWFRGLDLFLIEHTANRHISWGRDKLRKIFTLLALSCLSIKYTQQPAGS